VFGWDIDSIEITGEPPGQAAVGFDAGDALEDRQAATRSGVISRERHLEKECLQGLTVRADRGLNADRQARGAAYEARIVRRLSLVGRSEHNDVGAVVEVAEQH
jgi:hypothetical protein